VSRADATGDSRGRRFAEGIEFSATKAATGIGRRSSASFIPRKRAICFFKRPKATPRGCCRCSTTSATFAVSRQVDYLDWRPSLFATAPFRKLQVGEASQTLAPFPIFCWSTGQATRVGDSEDGRSRHSLADHLLESRLRWLALLQRGTDVEIDYTPDWPYEEAEFVTRVLAEPALRAPWTRRAGACAGQYRLCDRRRKKAAAEGPR
jgi:hypothetical protein